MGRRALERGQQGYALLELALALLITSLLAVWGVQLMANRLNDSQAQSAAVWMEAVHRALLAYVRQYGPDIQQAATPAALAAQGFQDWRYPDMAELKRAGLLSAGVPEETRLTGAARLTVWRQGSCPGEACVVEALLHGARPVHRAGEAVPDEAMMAQWLLAAQGQGAAVHPGDPARIRGAAFTHSSTLPDGQVLPAGTVGMAVTSEHQAAWNFLRVRDQRDPDFQAGVTVAETLRANGDVETAGQLVLGAQAQDGTWCTREHAVAHDVAGGLLVCRGGSWRSSSRAGGGYGYNLLHGCQTASGLKTANPVTGACTCPFYTATVLIFDSGPSPAPQGQQMAYLCVG